MPYIRIIMGLVALLLLATQPLRAQDYEVNWGKELKAKSEKFLDVAAYDQAGYYTLKMRKLRTPVIEHFDHENNKLKEGELDLKDGTRRLKYEFTVQLKEDLFLFTSYVETKDKKNNLYVQKIDLKTLKLLGKLKQVAEIDYAGKGNFNRGGFRATRSRDQSKILILYDPPYGKNEPEQLGFVVLDRNMEVLWAMEDQLPYPDKLFSLDLQRVDNDGNVYLGGPLTEDRAESKKHKGAAYAYYHILGYYKKGKEIRDFELKPDDKLITAMELTIDDQGNLVCGGFYSEKGPSGQTGVKGSFYMTVDQNSQRIIKRSFDEFTKDFILQNFTEKEEKKAEKRSNKKGTEPTLYRYELDDVILRDDGGAVLIGEQYYMQVTTSSYMNANGQWQTTTVYHYYYNDIIVVSVNPEGEIEWTHKIPKRQYSTNDGGFFSSYAKMIVGNKICFVFNDTPKNNDWKEGEKLRNFTPRSKESVVVAVTIDSDGVSKREIILEQERGEILLRPKMCEQVTGKEMVLFGQWRRGWKFGKLIAN